MTDKPMIFSGPMVRALIDGRKTQTRQIIKPQPEWAIQHWAPDQWLHWKAYTFRDEDQAKRLLPEFAPIKVGDRVWVRESFRGSAGYDGIPPSKWGNKPIWYEADGAPTEPHWGFLSDRSRPSIHMPRRYSRITLTVTQVRAERVQDISEEDAIAEGVLWAPVLGPVAAFSDLWNTIHGGGAWDANPWVWAYTSTVALANIDDLPNAA